MEVAGATQIDVIDDGSGFGVGGRAGARVRGLRQAQERCDAFVVETADRDGSRRDRLGAGLLDVAVKAQDPEAGSKTLLWVRAGREDGEDQPFGLGSHRCGPAAEAIRRPFGITPMRTRHMIGIGAMTATAIAPLRNGHLLAAAEDLDRLRARPDIDLLTDQAVRHRIEEAVEFYMVVGADAGEAPFSELVVAPRQVRERWLLDGLEDAGG